MITKKKFKKATGHKPEQDDLERVNCEKQNTPGHYQCGWCVKHNQPQSWCGCNIRKRIMEKTYE